MALVGKPKPSTSLFGAPRLWDGVPPQLPVLVSLSSMGVHGPEARRLHRSNAAGWHQGMGRRPRGRTEWRPSTHCFPVVAAAAASGGEEAEERGKAVAASEAERSILWSDEVVRWRRERSRWSTLDVATAGVVVSMHGLCLLAPFTFRWGALWTAVALYVVTGLLGITLSFHRNLAHRSFILPKWLEYTFAYCGVQALQGNPLDWVSTHRNHHQYCDSPRDPHSPIEGFWFSHVSWLFDSASVLRRCGRADNVGDLERQPFYRFIRRTYMTHPIALALLLYVAGGLPYLVWGMGVRIVWVYHITWLVNSACHLWGHQSWNTGDLSRNNWWVALLAFGEGWHNNHHAFEYSARHGLEWWEVDMTWYVVRLLQAVGLATHVRLPTAAHMRTMSLTAKVDAAFAAPHRRLDDTRSSLP